MVGPPPKNPTTQQHVPEKNVAPYYLACMVTWLTFVVLSAFVLVCLVLTLWHTQRVVPVYVISLSSGTRSRATVAARLHPHVSFTFFDAVDGHAVVDRSRFQKKIVAGQVGCALSHMTLWQYLLDTGVSCPVLVLEDDVVLVPGFARHLSRVIEAIEGSNVDLVFLGHCYESEGPEWKRCGITTLKRSQLPRCTHAYLVTPSALPKLVAWARLAVNMHHIDEELAVLVKRGYVTSVSCFPALAHQSGEASIING